MREGMKPEYEEIYLAVVAIASRCNNASSYDGAGFNKTDARFGNGIARKTFESWTPKMVISAHKMLKKYSKQLTASGISYDALPVPESPKFGKNVEVKDGRAYVSFDFDRAILNDIKTIPARCRNFNPETKVWDFDVAACGQDLAKILASHHFDIPGELLDAVPSTPSQKQDRRIILGQDHFALAFPFDRDIYEVVKQYSSKGAQWDKQNGVWTLPFTPSMTGLLRDLHNNYSFKAARGVTSKIQQIEKASLGNLEKSSSTETDYQVPDFPMLMDAQRVAVEFVKNHKRVMIADEQGVGKTLEAIAAVVHNKAFPALIVVPASVKYNWEAEVQTFSPGTSVEVIDGSDTPTYTSDITVINYDLLAKGWQKGRGKKVKLSNHAIAMKSRNLRSIVIDESHYIKNGDAQRSRAIENLCEGVEYRLLLTGTPTINRPFELVHQLKCLDRLDDMGGFWGFVKRYCKPEKKNFGRGLVWTFDGAEHLEELNERMRMQGFYLRRLKDEVLDLPEKRWADVVMKITNRDEYEYAEDQLISWVKDYTQEHALEIDEFKEWIESIDPSDIDDAIEKFSLDKAERAARAEILVGINSLRKLAAQGKIDSVKQWVGDFLQSGQKLLLFAHHKEVVDALAKEFDAPVIKGGVPAKKRQQIVEDFQNNPDTKLLVLNIQAGGEGLTLTASSNVAFVEFPWSPGKMDQASDRVHRKGQKNAVTVWSFVAQDTIDQKMTSLIASKRKIVSATNDGVGGDGDTSIMGDLMKDILSK